MNLIEELIAKCNDENKKIKLKYANYLYRDIVNENNEDLVDELLRIIVENAVCNDTETENKKEISFKNELLKKFYQYLIEDYKTEKTAYDYVKRIERICKEMNLSVDEVKNYLNNLICMYSDGEKREINKKQHNAPLSALKQLKNFFLEEERMNFYLSYERGFQSFEVLSKHVDSFIIEEKELKITFKENRTICENIEKTLSNQLLDELLKVFRKYKSILSDENLKNPIKFPFGGVSMYCYSFQDRSNHNGCFALFKSDDKNLEEQANKEVKDVLDKIIHM